MKNTTVNNERIAALESLVKAVYEREAAIIGFSDVPLELVHDTELGYIGACEYFVQKSLFTIKDVSRAHCIKINIPLLDRLIKSVLFTERARKKAAQFVVIHTVRHELRHAWQTVNAKHLLMQRTIAEGITDMVDGYGQRPQEADANQYAEQYDAGTYQAVLEACTLQQDLSGLLQQSAESANRTKRILRSIVKLNAKLTLGLSK